MSDVSPVGASATPGLEITTAPITDEIRTQWWSRLPYRHFELEITVFNGTQSHTGEITFEVGLPEDIIFDLNGATWNPLHRHELDGAIYEIWSPWSTVGSMPPNGHRRERLSVNLKPYVTHAVVLRRLFEDGDPISEWVSEEVPFKPFEPQL
ncbi:MAG: hypothetical protein WAL67_08915 [Candidatus Cybelea sp.]